MARILVTESLAAEGLALLRQAGEVDVRLKLPPQDLLGLVGDYEALVVRSSTQVTAEVLAAGARLAVVGRAGTGVDNVDLGAATRRGILVVNAPTSNTVAVAEHVIALMLCLARHLPRADASMHAGRWEKSSLMGTELRGKVLGLVGLGRVGTEVAVRARGLQMQVLAHDPFVSPERAAQLGVRMASFEELLAQADYVSLHTPLTERTRHMIGAQELARMKPSARLINCARGELVVEGDLVEALDRGALAGAALDVFPDEPHVNGKLAACPHVVLTPHLGASTEEAQSGAAVEVAQQVVDVLQGRPARYPVNLVALSSEESLFLRPYVDLANRLGRFYAQYAHNNLSHLELTYAGELAEHDSTVLTATVLAGLLSEASDEPVNVINARLVAAARGLVVSEVRTSEAQDLAGMITLRAQTTAGERVLAGTVLRRQPHILRIDGYWLDFIVEGLMLVSEHHEQRGIIGQMGTLLGEAGVSISFVQVGRQERGGMGLMVLGLDDALSQETLARLHALPSVRSARVVRL